MNNDPIALIKESFELWYNKAFPREFPVSIAINYSDEQRLAIKAIHTSRIEVSLLGIRNGMSFVKPIIVLQENYNHGTISEAEARNRMISKMLVEMYNYKR